MAGRLGKLRWINKGSQSTRVGISTVESKYGVTYIADLCIRTAAGEWSEHPVSIFWQANPKIELGHTHYMGAFVDRDGSSYVTNGISAAEGIWNAAVADNGEIVFSRWRHDFRESTDKSVMVDGGRDYFKCSNPSRRVALKLDGPDFIVVDG
jgi:hypothetical protein